MSVIEARAARGLATQIGDSCFGRKYGTQWVRGMGVVTGQTENGDNSIYAPQVGPYTHLASGRHNRLEDLERLHYMKKDAARKKRRRKPSGRGLSKRIWIWLPMLVATVAYLPSLGHSFVWDDVKFIVENPAAHEISELPTSLSHGYGWVPTDNKSTDSQLYFRPLVTAINNIQWVLSGGRPAAFHLLNLLTHAGTAVMVTILALLAGLSPGVAALAGCLFAVHPVHSEAVAWISGRADLLAAFFSLALLVQIAAWRENRLSKPLGGPAIGLTLFFALCSKESAFGLLILAPLLTALPNARRDRRGSGRTMIWVSLGLGAAVYFAWRFAVLHGDNAGVLSLLDDRGSLFERILFGGVLFCVYLFRLGVPWPLTTDPPTLLVGSSPPVGLGIVGLILLATAGIYAVSRVVGAIRAPAPTKGSSAHARPMPDSRWLPALGLGLFLLGLLPVLQWIPTGEIYGERFLYLPSAGLILWLAFLAGPWLSRKAWRLGAGFLILLLPSIVLLEVRLTDWKSDLSLFASTVRTLPESPRGLAAYGSALMKVGRQEEAESYLAKAVQLDPDDVRKRAQYGSLLVNLGRAEEGVRELNHAYESKFRSLRSLKNLGLGRLRLGQDEAAVQSFREALALSRDDPAVLEGLAVAVRRLGRYAEADRLLEEALPLDPYRKETYLNLIALHVYGSQDWSKVRAWGYEFLRRFPEAPEVSSVRTLLDQAPADPVPN